MYGFYNMLDKFRRHQGFSASEKKWLLASVIVMGLIYGFDDGRKVFELVPWLQHMVLGVLAIAVAVIVHEVAHRLVGSEAGFRIEFKPFIYGLIAGVIIAFMSYGKLIFLAYGSVHFHTLEKHRLGYFRYHKGYFQLGKIAAFGPVANIFLAMIFKSLGFLPDAVQEVFVAVNVLFAITNLLPIPPLDGAHLMYASRTVYFLVFGAVLTTGLLLLFSDLSIIYTMLAAAAGALLTAVFYFRNVEPKISGSW